MVTFVRVGHGAELFAALKAEALGYVAPPNRVFVDLRPPDGLGQEGYLLPILQLGPGRVDHCISVHTDVDPADEQKATIRDAINLAHEMGHLQRRLSGDEDPDYARAADRVATEGTDLLRPVADKAIAEERAAWELARTTLQRHGFAAWPTFEAQAAAALATYETALRD